MLTVKGVQRVSGTFEGREYDNLNLHCLNDTPSREMINGSACEIIKVKWCDLLAVFNGLVKNQADVSSLVGLSITPFYDRNGRAVRIDFDNNKEGGAK